ncbi:hypothetical protein [Tautonia marina]|uniref:hypothetical protein n=1 Tax=Tautonia marina TaxID=2653855 RepID=UPI0012605E2B|nr:hypothetical protein [Tautonia marina]
MAHEQHADEPTFERPSTPQHDPDRKVRDAAIRRIAGSMADDPEFDAATEQVRRDRLAARDRDEPCS